MWYIRWTMKLIWLVIPTRTCNYRFLVVSVWIGINSLNYFYFIFSESKLIKTNNLLHVCKMKELLILTMETEACWISPKKGSLINKWCRHSNNILTDVHLLTSLISWIVSDLFVKANSKFSKAKRYLAL